MRAFIGRRQASDIDRTVRNGSVQISSRNIAAFDIFLKMSLHLFINSLFPGRNAEMFHDFSARQAEPRGIAAEIVVENAPFYK